jgi:hypothetical protein
MQPIGMHVSCNQHVAWPAVAALPSKHCCCYCSMHINSSYISAAASTHHQQHRTLGYACPHYEPLEHVFCRVAWQVHRNTITSQECACRCVRFRRLRAAGMVLPGLAVAWPLCCIACQPASSLLHCQPHSSLPDTSPVCFRTSCMAAAHSSWPGGSQGVSPNASASSTSSTSCDGAQDTYQNG